MRRSTDPPSGPARLETANARARSLAVARRRRPLALPARPPRAVHCCLHSSTPAPLLRPAAPTLRLPAVHLYITVQTTPRTSRASWSPLRVTVNVKIKRKSRTVRYARYGLTALQCIVSLSATPHTAPKRLSARLSEYCLGLRVSILTCSSPISVKEIYPGGSVASPVAGWCPACSILTRSR